MSEEELSRCSQDKRRVADIRAGIEMLMSEVELNIQFKSSGSRWSRRVEQMMKDWFPRHNGPWIRCAFLIVLCSANKMSEEEEESRAFTNFCIARESHPGWMGCHPYWVKIWDDTTTVKLIYAPNKNSKFFLLQYKVK